MSDNQSTPALIPASTTQDEKWMRAALAQSQIGQGWTSPRPSVGCVLVREGKIIGAAHTTPGHGNPHAEIGALNAALAAGESTPGATAYVTLEPCSHFATTPPCSQALIQAGITRVVAGVRDPNPAVNGSGYEQLRNAGIEVVSDFMMEECARIHDQFLKHIVTGAPFVTLKCATSLDGKIALASGESQWITNEESRRRAHVLRHEHDAILVGIETVLCDDPQLNVRLEGRWKQPARVILDSRGRTPLHAKLLQDTSTPLFIATTDAMPENIQSELEARGARVLRCGEDAEQAGRVDWRKLLKALYENEIFSVLIEGGASVASSALQQKVFDKVVWFVAPILIGNGRDALAEYSAHRLHEAPRLRDVQSERIGDDVMISGYLNA